MKRRVIGITGGIGTGKSTVADYLNRICQIPILDADHYAREAVAKGSPILNALTERYGNDILNDDGSLQRSRLGEIIFNQPGEKQWVEQQIHPYVRHRIETELSQRDQAIIAVVIPLLFEAQMTDLVTEIWVVYCSAQQQLSRIMQRDGVSESTARSRMNAQMSIEEKVTLADLIIDNSTTVTELYNQITQALAANQPEN